MRRSKANTDTDATASPASNTRDSLEASAEPRTSGGYCTNRSSTKAWRPALISQLLGTLQYQFLLKTEVDWLSMIRAMHPFEHVECQGSCDAL